MKQSRLYTKRLFLRPFELGDLKATYDLCSRPETSRYSLWEPHKNYWDSFRYLWFVWFKSAGVHWAVLCRESGRHIGSCSFVQIKIESKEGEIGYSVHPDYWHRGYGTEIARALISYGFEKMGLSKVYVRVMPENIHSIALAEKAGMKRRNQENEFVPDGDIRREVVRLEISREEYCKK